jgi:hypothetical protein
MTKGITAGIDYTTRIAPYAYVHYHIAILLCSLTFLRLLKLVLPRFKLLE